MSEAPKFERVSGSPFTTKQTSRIGKTLLALTRKKKLISEDDIIEAAANPKSDIHEFFEWDDKVAAKLYRRGQARKMLIYIRIVLQPQTRPTVCTFTVKGERDGQCIYVKTLGVRFGPETPKKRESRLELAINQLASWVSQYHDLKELAKVVEEARKLI